MFYSVMDPHRSFSNSIVKGYSGDDTKRGAFWENNTMSKFLFVFNRPVKLKFIDGYIINNII